MTNALQSRIASMTADQIVTHLGTMAVMFGKARSGRWGDEASMVRAELLCALEDVHGWSEGDADILDADLFWGEDRQKSVREMHA